MVYFHRFWYNIRDQWAVQISQIGYMIEFMATPLLTTTPYVTDLPLIQHLILLEEINQMLLKDAIEEVSGTIPSFYSTFFLVPKKKRLASYTESQRFNRVRSSRNVQNVNCIQGFTVSVTRGLAGINRFERCVHSCPDFTCTQKVPQVCIPEKSLPVQGASLWTKLSSKGLYQGVGTATPIVGFFAAFLAGVHIYPYLDNCLIVGKSKDMLLPSPQLSLDILRDAGFLVNIKKSQLLPSQDLQFLGMSLNSFSTKAYMTLQRIEDLKLCLLCSAGQGFISQQDYFFGCWV